MILILILILISVLSGALIMRRHGLLEKIAAAAVIFAVLKMALWAIC